jgi:peptidoglycan/LPS O-acetylase OafA/YrhL
VGRESATSTACSFAVLALLPFVHRARTRTLLAIFAILFAVTPLLSARLTSPQYARYLIYFYAGIALCAVSVRTTLLQDRIPRLLDRLRVARACLVLLAFAPWLYMDAIQHGLAWALGKRGRVYRWLTIGEDFQEGWLEIGSAVLLVALVLTWPRAQRALAAPFGQWLGRHSFSVYLVHMPILASFSSHLFLMAYGRGMPYNAAALLTYAASLPLVYVVAALMTRYVDRFALRFGRFRVDGWLGRIGQKAPDAWAGPGGRALAD